MIQLTFTGQAIVKIVHGQEFIKCQTCNDAANLIGMRSTAWFDPYVNIDGAYVHFKCLSVKRKDEIKNDVN